jgi:flagellar motor switch/type III secretory pathway protein FliN
MTNPSALSHLFDIPLAVEATVSGPALRVSELLTLRAGSVIATRRAAGENIDLFAGDAYIGSGELAQINGHIAVRMVKLKGKS